MKTFSAAIALALLCLVSFVTADHLPNPAGLSADDSSDMSLTQSGLRGHSAVGLVSNTITANDNKILVKNSNIVLSKSDRGLFGLLTRVATTPGVLSNAAGIISAARSGDTGALAGHVVGLLGAAIPPATPAPVAPMPGPVAPMVPPVSTPIDTPATPSIPMAPIYATSPVSPQVAPAAAMTPPAVPTMST
eukprot:jgi/Phyca11/20018/fgenesh1_pg.PHYCAscaffold_55_\